MLSFAAKRQKCYLFCSLLFIVLLFWSLVFPFKNNNSSININLNSALPSRQPKKFWKRAFLQNKCNWHATQCNSHTLLVCFIPVFSIALTLWTTILSSFLFIFTAKQTTIMNTIVTFKIYFWITLLLKNYFRISTTQDNIIRITWKMNM